MQSNEEIWGEDKIDTYGRENLCLLQKKFHYVVVVIEKSQNMDVISIQGLIAKVQAHEKRVNEIRECGCTCIFFKVR
jgi:hypothetical protein